MTCYNVFVRNWWRHNPDWLEPHAGRKTFLRKHVTEADARAICKQHNDTHNPGRLAEYEKA
jgi:hypothetical protein